MTLGDFSKSEFSDEKLIAFIRSFADEKLLVVHNLSNQNIEKEWNADDAQLIFSTQQSIECKDHKLIYKPKSSYVFKLKN